MKIVVTGTRGLLGWHAAARLHAVNCAARYRGDVPPYELEMVDRVEFSDAARLAAAMEGAAAVLHFAGVNRGPDDEVANGNPGIANRVVEACVASGSTPHIVYANSTHSAGDTAYGRSKRMAAGILASGQGGFTNLVLPHIFGECARPYYNNVTATLIDKLWKGEIPDLDPTGQVRLLHAGAAADMAIDAALKGHCGAISPPGRETSVVELYDRLVAFHASYMADVFPDLSDAFDLALFNSYRTGGYPSHYPKPMRVNEDRRGILFETARTLAGSQSFVSTTLPGQRRGDHFHTDLVERFLVVRGKATIRIRRVLTDEVQSFDVDGNQPYAIDMPPLHTHHIENCGTDEVVTFFWSHRLFDPAVPDTYADPVLN